MKLVPLQGLIMWDEYSKHQSERLLHRCGQRVNWPKPLTMRASVHSPGLYFIAQCAVRDGSLFILESLASLPLFLSRSRGQNWTYTRNTFSTLGREKPLTMALLVFRECKYLKIICAHTCVYFSVRKLFHESIFLFLPAEQWFPGLVPESQAMF